FYTCGKEVLKTNCYIFNTEALLVSGNGEYVGYVHYYNGKFNAYQRTYILYNITGFAKFIKFFLDVYLSERIELTKSDGNTPYIVMDTLSEMIVKLPIIQEQQAIAQVLTDMDAEIELLEQQRSKYTALKQGTMQQLLTGQIRLVADRQIRQTDKSTKQANVHFKRSVWAAEIVDRLCNEPTFGHVKMEKMIFLTEHLCGVDIGSNYHRDAAGPYDNRAIRSIDSQLKKQNWFEAKREERAIRYIPLSKRGGHKDYFNKYFSDVQADFDKVINTFSNWNTERCEIVATLYSAWKDIVSAQKSYSDEDIINEVLNNWHESKKRIPIERWQLALNWMREKGFEPKL
ncbi:MAG: restriction endonuclease subunit S, partial [Oscillospiraceae bacterium]